MSRLCVAVGISDYGPELDRLPGAPRAAEKIFEWGKSAGYYSMLVTDDHKKPVTVDRLKGMLEPILETTEFERVIFYFAGHGTIASAAAEKWLLSRAVNEPDEAIDRTAFLWQLATFNVKQIALLIDACRSQSKIGLHVHGRGVVRNSGSDRKNPQMDIFLAASLGDSAFHVKDPMTGEWRCLFTETLLDGLYGRDARAIEREFHPAAPAVVSGSLAKFLLEEVSARAAQLDKKSEPEIQPAFLRPDDVYLKLAGGMGVGPPEGVRRPEPELEPRPFEAAPSATPAARGGEAEMREALEQIVPELLKPAVLDGDFQSFYALGEPRWRMGFGSLPLVGWSRPPREIASRGPGLEFTDSGMRVAAIRVGGRSANLFVKTDEGNWCFVPLVGGLLNVLTIGPSSLQVMNFLDLDDLYGSTNAYREVLAPLVEGNLRAGDATWLADNMRYLKHQNPVMGVIAAYLYAARGDFDNIVRIADYYFMEQQPVPLDIALLGAERIQWEPDAELGFRVEADFGKVDRAKENTAIREQRPEFTRVAFEAKKNVAVAGFMPWMTQGWGIFEREKGREIPGLLLEVRRAVLPGTFAALTEDAGEFLIRELGFDKVRLAEPEEGGMVTA
jgi:hypothetical protein